MVLKDKTFCKCLVVQWLRLRAPHSGRQGSIPGLGTRISHVATKDPVCCNKATAQPNRINKYFFFFFFFTKRQTFLPSLSNERSHRTNKFGNGGLGGLGEKERGPHLKFSHRFHNKGLAPLSLPSTTSLWKSC